MRGPTLFAIPAPEPTEIILYVHFRYAIGVTMAIVMSLDSAATEPTVDNLESGATIRYSVVLLRGSVPAGAASIQIENKNASDRHGEVNPVVQEGKFKALVELSPGKNLIELSTNGQGDPTEFVIHYKPQTNPRFVRLVWMTDSSGDTRYASPKDEAEQDYESRLRTAALLMQTFTAERMNQLGYGHRTFRLERDESGEVIVHTWKGTEPREAYYQMGDSNRYWNGVRVWLDQKHPEPMAKNIVLAAFTRKDPRTGKMKGHTALGGANLGLFGSASVFSWPVSIESAVDSFQDSSDYDVTKVHDDSVGRKTVWGLASTTIGATLHEMGHTFGLPHVSDRHGIMSRGFDYFNRAFTFRDPPSGRNAENRFFATREEAYFCPASASFLRWSPWFQLDKQTESTARPNVRFDRESQTVSVSCDDGVPWVGFHVDGQIRGFREFDLETPPKEISLTLEEIKALLGGKTPQQVRTISAGGQQAGTRIRIE